METISSAEEIWLDHEANIVYEQRVIDSLEAAPDYERGPQGLTMLVRELSPSWGSVYPGFPGINGSVSFTFLYASNAKHWQFFTGKGSEYEKRPKEPKTTVQPSTSESIKKENATLAQRIEILDWHHKNGGSQTATAEHFARIYPNLKIKQPLISSWLRDESKWRVQWEQTNKDSDRIAKRVRQTEHPEVSEMMDVWVSKAMDDGVLLTGEILRQQWSVFADLVGVPEDERLKLSSGWLGSFKRRHGLKGVKRIRRGSRVDSACSQDKSTWPQTW